MVNKILKFLVVAIAILTVLYPLWVRFQNTPQWSFDLNLAFILFPYFGLLAVSLLWLHVVSGFFEDWLRANFNFDKFVNITSYMILVSIILHPLLLFVGLKFRLGNMFVYYDAKYVWLGIVAFFLLITYDVGKFFIKRNFFAKNWNKILLISTTGFLLSFIHSLKIGSDLQSNPLRSVWIFYGVTALIATIWTYGLKRFWK